MALRTRTILGLVLGAAAGALLCLVVLPLGLGRSGYGQPAALAYYLLPWVALSMLLMALGGAAVTWSRHALEAVKAFSLAGLLAGAFTAAMALDASPRLLAAAGLTGWLYGLLAGLPLLRLSGGERRDDGAGAAAGTNPGPDQAGATSTAGLDGDAI